MKPESVKAVKSAYIKAGNKWLCLKSPKLSQQDYAIQAAIRAVMETPEVRGLISALRHYQWLDDESHRMLKGFTAKQTDIDVRSPARQALAALEQYGKSPLQSACDAVEDMRELQREAALAALEAGHE